MKHVLREKRYIRYTDDFVIVHRNPIHLEQVKGKIEVFLRSSLRLEFHPNKVEIRKYSRGIDFLGYVLLPHATVLRTKTRRRISRKIRHRVLQAKRGDISEESLQQSLASYMGVLGHANSHLIEQKMRDEIWRLWKDTGI